MDDADFDPEKTEYTFEPGDGGENGRITPASCRTVKDFLKEEYELVHGYLDPEDSRRNGNGVWNMIDDPASLEIGEVPEGELSEFSEMIRKDFYLKFSV